MPKPHRSISHLLTNVLRALTYALPVTLFFSYYPIISLGSNSSMNFELSLPLIWLVVFDVVSLAMLLSYLYKRHSATKASCTGERSVSKVSHTRADKHPLITEHPGLSDRRFFLFSIFPLYATASIFWSENPLRGILTAGVIWAVFFAVFSILYILPMLDKTEEVCYNETNPSSRAAFGVIKTFINPQILFRVFFISTAAVCIFCFVQSLLDILGVSRDTTLLCAGCTYRSFGFPHPSGFAIEPQFMGNLLLAPTLTALYLICFRKPSAKTAQSSSKSTSAKALKTNSPSTKSAKLPTIFLYLAAGLFSLTLFFTFSRGAIYAYGVALAILIMFAIIRRHFRPSLIIIPVVTFLLSLGLQGTFAALGPTSETFGSAVAKSVHQLSLGLIDFRPAHEELAATSSDPATAPASSETAAELASAPTFDGYVPESTNYRLLLNEVAIDTWLASSKNFKIGVGLGGAGTAMNHLAPESVTSPKEIVQNEPISLLLELGLFGAMIIVFELLLAFFPNFFPAKFLDGRAAKTGKEEATFWSHPALPLLFALIVAYVVSLNFFSGLPNALHIYLLPPLLYVVLRQPPEN